MSDTKTLTVQNEQREKAKKFATFAMLQSKKPAEKVVDLDVNGEIVSLRFVALGALEYDDLATLHPATTAQKAKGMSFNVDTFPPALLSAVVREPAGSPEDWAAILKAPEWNSGEVGDLFQIAIELCNSGLSLGPTGRG